MNTLVFSEDGRIQGSSTDGFGFLESLTADGVDLTHLRQQGPALLFGAGGAARSIATALLEQGFSVIISNRTEPRAHALVKDLSQAWEEHTGNSAPDLSVQPWATPESVSGDISLLVNTTSLGMSGGPDTAWMPDLAHASENLVVCDIVYIPRETPLLKAATQRGLVAVGGLGMLLHQARPGFRAWFGTETTVDAATIDYVSDALKCRA
ncbi:shikimate 5-dehydrogenase [Acetobacter oeni LMG 21952]|nr:shikimate 5-dehydrogenase [Acetobacter oeni LMG 21952]